MKRIALIALAVLTIYGSYRVGRYRASYTMVIEAPLVPQIDAHWNFAYSTTWKEKAKGISNSCSAYEHAATPDGRWSYFLDGGIQGIKMSGRILWACFKSVDR